MSRSSLVTGVAAAVFACIAPNVAADEQFPEKSAIVVGKPMVSGKGPYIVQFQATVTLERAATEFTGARMELQDANRKGAKPIAVAVNFPDASPKPGQVRNVVFTVAVPQR